ncbi:hypothetical protein [Nocardia wallacei]|uniref:hypothetical protein n=1 Tax=Nocardia wallacei TaxID=480035 RepID=UPI002457E76B|nr:hypothetical protein [Nocardia wallacei]
MIDTTGLTADTQLTRGEPGLHRLQEFIEPYATWTGSNAPGGYDIAALRAQYDAERGLDLTDLATFADTLSAQLIAAREQAGVQSTRAGQVGSAWTEGAGTDAAALLSQVAARVGTDVEKLAGLATSIGTALTEIAASLRQKADTSESVFGALTIGGKQASEVEQIAMYAQGDFGLVDSEDGKRTLVRAVLPDLPEGTDPQQYAADWMTETFVPEFETRVGEFATLNQNTRTAISQHYTEMLTTFEGLDHSPYPGPAPVSTALYSGGVPADTTPAATPPQSTGEQQVSAAPESPAASQSAQGAVVAAPSSQVAQQQQSTPVAAKPAQTENPIAGEQISESGGGSQQAGGVDQGLKDVAATASEISTIVGTVSGVVDVVYKVAQTVEAPLTIIDHVIGTVAGAIDFGDGIAARIEAPTAGEQSPGSGGQLDSGGYPPGNEWVAEHNQPGDAESAPPAGTPQGDDAAQPQPVDYLAASKDTSTSTAEEGSASSGAQSDPSRTPAAFGMPMMPPSQQGARDGGEHRAKIQPHKSIFAAPEEPPTGAEPILVPDTSTASTTIASETPDAADTAGDEVGASEATANGSTR